MRFPLFLIFILSSCGSSKPEEEEEKKEVPKIQRIVIGRIASVSAEGDFVLIQRYDRTRLPAESIYQSEGPEDRRASLRPSGEKVRDFFAADLVGGNAAIGDTVLVYLSPEKVEETEIEVTQLEN